MHFIYKIIDGAKKIKSLMVRILVTAQYSLFGVRFMFQPRFVSIWM